MENKNIEAGESLEVRLGQLLLRKGLTMGTAESCTGGKIASLMTSVAGSSAYFVGGVVSYTNEVKHQVLGVSSEALDRYGAVSQAVVEQMAQGATRVLGCDCAVAQVSPGLEAEHLPNRLGPFGSPLAMGSVSVPLVSIL